MYNKNLVEQSGLGGY